MYRVCSRPSRRALVWLTAAPTTSSGPSAAPGGGSVVWLTLTPRVYWRVLLGAMAGGCGGAGCPVVVTDVGMVVRGEVVVRGVVCGEGGMVTMHYTVDMVCGECSVGVSH